MKKLLGIVVLSFLLSGNVYSKIIICNLTYKETINLHNKGEIILINALPSEYYAKQHISNSYNLHHNVIKKMSNKEINKWFNDVIKNNYPIINKLVNQKKIDIYEIPIVVYCAHDKCSASESSVIELYKKGFYNVREFKGGMKDYLKNIKKL